MGWKNVPLVKNKLYDAKVGLKPGDIILWGPSEHVGVYTGNGMCVSNSSGGKKAAPHPVLGYFSGWKYIVRVVRAPS